MKGKILTAALYKTFNILNKGRLTYFYNEAKTSNENGVSNRHLLTDYLSQWGFDTELERNPAMDKTIIKEWINKTEHRKVHSWAYTGGSYGEPLRVPYSKTRGLIRTASLVYFNQLGGYTIGDPYALIRAKDKLAVLKFLRNEMIIVPYDTSSFKIEEMVLELIRRNVILLMGYPSVIYEMALFLKYNPSVRQRLKVNHIISVSEPLESYKQKVIRETFNCPFVDRYSNEEVGIIAQQRYAGEEYYVNQYGIFVEVVDPNTLLPVPEGLQGKVLVTDINNDLIPMIRYDTGDLATVNSYIENRLVSISSITGRVTEQITNPEGKPVSPLTIGPFIYKPLSKENKLVPYQFVQKGPAKYELRLKTNQGEISDSLSSIIMTGLAGLFGPDADVSIILVKDIACQPSGKRPVFKNETQDATPSSPTE